jgi:heptaprenyl diphosphate synthase
MNGEYDSDQLMVGAVAVELMHMASLIHDDILDDAATRRGVSTILSAQGREVALASGDFLFATSFSLLCGLEIPELLLIISQSAVSLSTGELKQMQGVHSVQEQTIVAYLGRIKDKTASLFHSSCRIGGIIAGADEAEIKKLMGYGESLGMAFQICDDILDIVGTEKVLGKPPGQDLKEGLVTLPILYALEETNYDEAISLVIQGKATGEPQIEQAIKLVVKSGGIEKARDEAMTYIKHAIHIAGELADEQVSESLVSIGNFVMERYH